MKAVAWTLPSKEDKDSEMSFCMQVTGVTLKNKKKVVRSLDEWRLGGEGYNVKTKKEIIFAYKEFPSKKALKKWAQKFPYPVFLQEEKTTKLKKLNKAG